MNAPTEAPFVADFGVKSVKAATSGDLHLEGFASDWGEDFQSELFEPNAFDSSLQDFLTRNPICLYNHDLDRPLGVIESAEIRPEGLWVRARVDRPVPGSWADREDVFQKIAKGTIRGFSVAGAFFRRPSQKGLTKIYKSPERNFDYALSGQLANSRSRIHGPEGICDERARKEYVRGRLEFS